jgi:hypothetical protein
MRNLHIEYGKEVPYELRQEVYKETLGNILTETYPQPMFEPCLCYYLLMVLFGSGKVLHDHPRTGENMFFGDTYKMFPELTQFLTKKNGWGDSYTNEERIEFLKSVIKN